MTPKEQLNAAELTVLKNCTLAGLAICAVLAIVWVL